MADTPSQILAAELSRRGEPAEDLAARLDELLAACAAAWPRVTLDPASFTQQLLERCQAPTLAAWLDGAHAPDLYLAVACLARVPEALASFDSASLSRTPEWLKRLDLSEAAARDIGQTLAEKLLLGDRPKLADYQGRGPLDGWLRVVALRTAIDRARRRGEVLSTAAQEQAQAAPDDPELELMRARHRDDFRAAFEAAVAELEHRERNLLRLHYVDGVKIDDLAARFHVHRMTIMRWMAAARRTILDGARQSLREHLKLSDSEYLSLFRVIRSELDVSLGPLLRH
jgi:RNA polymerase sigma-70 factor (ECF subfamily)